MKILFVFSGNNSSGISPFVKADSESLIERGVVCDFAPIVGHGFLAYLKSIFIIRKAIKLPNPDIIHAYYSLSGIVASLAMIGIGKAYKKPVIVSILGSDVKRGNIILWVTRFFSKYVWRVTNAGSERLKKELNVKSALTIPAGVDTSFFMPMDKVECRLKLGWDLDVKYVLFGASPTRPEKNFSLAEKTISLIKQYKIQLVTLGSVPQKDMPIYLNAIDVLLITSFREGGPVINKEAMACNTPIVSVDVGDVKQLLDGIEGCYVTSYDPEDIATKILLAINCDEKTTGRARIFSLGLDSMSLTDKILHVYQAVIQNN